MSPRGSVGTLRHLLSLICQQSSRLLFSNNIEIGSLSAPVAPHCPSLLDLGPCDTTPSPESAHAMVHGRSVKCKRRPLSYLPTSLTRPSLYGHGAGEGHAHHAGRLARIQGQVRGCRRRAGLQLPASQSGSCRRSSSARSSRFSKMKECCSKQTRLKTSCLAVRVVPSLDTAPRSTLRLPGFRRWRAV